MIKICCDKCTLAVELNVDSAVDTCGEMTVKTFESEAFNNSFYSAHYKLPELKGLTFCKGCIDELTEVVDRVSLQQKKERTKMLLAIINQNK